MKRIVFSLLILILFANSSQAAFVRLGPPSWALPEGDIVYSDEYKDVDFPIVFYIVSNSHTIYDSFNLGMYSDYDDQKKCIEDNFSDKFSIPIYQGYIVIDESLNVNFHNNQCYRSDVDTIISKSPYISIRELANFLCMGSFGAVYVTSGIEPYKNFEPVFESTVHFSNLEEFMKPNDPVHYSPIITNPMPGMKPIYLNVPFDGLP